MELGPESDCICRTIRNLKGQPGAEKVVRISRKSGLLAERAGILVETWRWLKTAPTLGRLRVI